jgi:Lon-like ATP-dependent protease
VLYIEAQKIPSDGKSGGTIKVTGRLGDVMQESSSIAHTVARAFLMSVADDCHLDDTARMFFQEASLHLHFPEGSVKKDGPSAGIAIVTALLSLAMDRPVSAQLAMTGEVSLTGRVLPIGGVKEKTLGSKRSGIDTLIFPEENRRDWEELSDELKAGMTVRFAKSYADVFRVAFPEGAAGKGGARGSTS